MEKLKELVDVVTKNKVKSIEIIGFTNDSDTKIMQLYDGIQNGTITSDSDAFDYLYDDCRQDKNPYYKLKHTLRERLYNTLFFIDLKSSKYSDIKKAYLYCQKMITLVNLLITKGAANNAINIAEKAIKVAIQYEFSLEIVHLAKHLRRHYALIAGDRKKFQHFHQLMLDYHQLSEAEARAEGYFYDLLSIYVKSKSTNEETRLVASTYLKDLSKYQLAIESSNYIYLKTMVEITIYMSQNNYQKALDICHESLVKLEQHHFQNTRAVTFITFQKIACCIQLKLYKKGEEAIEKCLEFIEAGLFNWFKLQELFITLCLHTQSYGKAQQIFETVIGHEKFKKLSPNVREVWKIYEAWLHFLKKAEKMGKLNGFRSSETKNFKVSKYVNEVPIYSRDKRGLNVPILISQIALLLQQKKYDTIIDRVEAIEKYKDRYLNKSDNYRSNIFIRMLLEIPKGDFSYTRVIRKTEKFTERLKDIPLEVANQSHDLEILPYEDIWSIILSELKKR